MAKPTSSVALPQRPSPSPSYRPLSVLALAALIVSAGYAVVVAFLTGAALVSGNPLVLSVWTLLFPLAGAALAASARQQIRRSEGTLSGEGLATWGWWLSLLLGLGFGAYYFGTYLAVWQQANGFAQAWFENIRAGKTNEAFLSVVDPGQRRLDQASLSKGDVDTFVQRYGLPSFRYRSYLHAFRENEVVHAVVEGGAASEVRSLGVNGWEVTKDGYMTRLNYHITTPLGAFDALVVARGTEGREFQGREWVILSNQTKLTSRRLTPLGVTVEEWRQSARKFAENWLRKLQRGDYDRAFAETMDPAVRPALARGVQLRAGVAALAGLANAVLASASPGRGPCGYVAAATLAFDPDVSRSVYWPELRAFRSGDWVLKKDFFAPAKLRADILRAFAAEFGEPGQTTYQFEDGVGVVRPIAEGADRMEFLVPILVKVRQPHAGKGVMPFTIESDLLVVSDRGPVTSDRKPQWQVVQLDLLRGTVPPQVRPGISTTTGND